MVIAFFCQLKKGTYTKLIILSSIGYHKTVLKFICSLNPKGVNRSSHTSKTMLEENTFHNDIGCLHPQTPGPLFEDLQQKSTPEHHDLVELKENVAYGPIAKHSV